jgi:inhibitor of cysteine peptidase
MKNLYLAENNNEDETTIHRFSFEKGSINYVGSGKTPGRILNQFSLDEYEGKLRVATTKGNLWSGSSRNNLYVLDENMKIAGKLEDLAPGERIYSVRFMGKKAYVVTFKKVDPLFLIDFSDLNPKVLGKLKIPGYSDYLHPYDENHIIGIGKDAIDAEEGNFAWYQGLKMAMFDVSDVENPKEVDTVLLGARGSESPVLHNHKAFLFDKEKQLLVIPATLTEKKNNAKPNEYGDFVFQGALVFQVTPTGFKLRGNVTHIEDPQTYLKSGYYFESQSAIERSLYINDVLYTFSASRLQLNSLHDLQTLRKIDLNN